MLSSYTTYHFLVACSLKDGKLGYHLPACSGLPQLRFRCKFLCLRPFSHDMAKGSSEWASGVDRACRERSIIKSLSFLSNMIQTVD